MVSAVPNLTRLTGVVAARRAHPDLDGWDLVTLAVHAAAPVEGVADLLGRRVGEQLPVAVRRELLAEAAVGDVLSLRARLTPAGAVAENRPAAGDFTLTPR